jgi:hypothetical protein
MGSARHDAFASFFSNATAIIPVHGEAEDMGLRSTLRFTLTSDL